LVAFGCFLTKTLETDIRVPVKSWRVGRNPPFVFCGIRLIGLPAPPVDSSQASVCPFHLQVGRFTVSHLAPQQLNMYHCHLPDGRFVSAPLPRFSPCALADAAILRVGGVSSSLHISGSEATHQLASQNITAQVYAIRILENLFYQIDRITYGLKTR
jgi:hypothetical protein